jgi:hypothetical protein
MKDEATESLVIYHLTFLIRHLGMRATSVPFTFLF